MRKNLSKPVVEPAFEIERREHPYLCVFCGSSMGIKPVYADTAKRVGAAIATNRMGLVYGGGRVGLMGVVADATLAGGGPVVGVIPDPLATKEVAHHGVTPSSSSCRMHERKAKMAERAAGFLTLPVRRGDPGRILRDPHLGGCSCLHRKPLGILNVDGPITTPSLPFSTPRSLRGSSAPAPRTHGGLR